MKIITLNTHSLVEKGYEKKLRQFADMVLAEQPDVFALQEVNQSVQAGCLAEEKLPGFVACPGIGRGLREDNHAARLAQILFAAAPPITGLGFRPSWATENTTKGWRFLAGAPLWKPIRF